MKPAMTDTMSWTRRLTEQVLAPKRDGAAPLLEVSELRTHFANDGTEFRAVDGVSFTLFAGRTLASSATVAAARASRPTASWVLCHGRRGESPAVGAVREHRPHRLPAAQFAKLRGKAASTEQVDLPLPNPPPRAGRGRAAVRG